MSTRYACDKAAVAGPSRLTLGSARTRNQPPVSLWLAAARRELRFEIRTDVNTKLMGRFVVRAETMAKGAGEIRYSVQTYENGEAVAPFEGYVSNFFACRRTKSRAPAFTLLGIISESARGRTSLTGGPNRIWMHLATLEAVVEQADCPPRITFHHLSPKGVSRPYLLGQKSRTNLVLEPQSSLQRLKLMPSARRHKPNPVMKSPASARLAHSKSSQVRLHNHHQVHTKRPAGLV